MSHVNQNYRWGRSLDILVLFLNATTEWGSTVSQAVGWKICLTIWRCMADLGVIQSVEGWEGALFSLSSLPTAFRLADPSVSPLQIPSWGTMDKCCHIPSLSWHHRGDIKEEDGPDRKHQHISGLYPSDTAQSDSATRHGERKVRHAGWLKVNLWSCWFAAEWQMDGPERGQTGAVCLFIWNLAPKQRAPCHPHYSIFLGIMPQHCAHVKTHTRGLTLPRAGRGYKSNK